MRPWIPPRPWATWSASNRGIASAHLAGPPSRAMNARKPALRDSEAKASASAAARYAFPAISDNSAAAQASIESVMPAVKLRGDVRCAGESLRPASRLSVIFTIPLVRRNPVASSSRRL